MEASEASELTGTAQNLGMASGTAIVGSVILAVTASSFVAGVAASPTFTDDQKERVRVEFEVDVRVLTTPEFDEAVSATPPDVQEETLEIPQVSVTDGFQAAIIAGGLVALLGFAVASRLPKQKIPHVGLEEEVRSAAIPLTHLEAADL